MNAKRKQLKFNLQNSKWMTSSFSVVLNFSKNKNQNKTLRNIVCLNGRWTLNTEYEHKLKYSNIAFFRRHYWTQCIIFLIDSFIHISTQIQVALHTIVVKKSAAVGSKSVWKIQFWLYRLNTSTDEHTILKFEIALSANVKYFLMLFSFFFKYFNKLQPIKHLTIINNEHSFSASIIIPNNNHNIYYICTWYGYKNVRS